MRSTLIILIGLVSTTTFAKDDYTEFTQCLKDLPTAIRENPSEAHIKNCEKEAIDKCTGGKASKNHECIKEVGPEACAELAWQKQEHGHGNVKRTFPEIHEECLRQFADPPNRGPHGRPAIKGG